ncbi:hypothetical protein FB567DRAFT_585740 [Paraphoma chrysanthemicola]|uniref:Uncharacterized protein n=1 Tax=Paraphoma chrysanthemicola TaxID=798071 RepID=A0A8K0W3Y4_9PLEO|nr:hypothetical protein FB567DRAFT_585740 [Paraphoma chrysanthemicola]
MGAQTRVPAIEAHDVNRREIMKESRLGLVMISLLIGYKFSVVKIGLGTQSRTPHKRTSLLCTDRNISAIDIRDMTTRGGMLKIHPQGDTVLILRNTDGGPLQDWPDHDEMRYLVSSTQLRAVSRHWSRFFESNSPETIPNPADGRYHIREYDLSARAMWIVLQLAHWKADITPHDTKFSIYTAVKIIVQLYSLEAVLAVYLETMAERSGEGRDCSTLGFCLVYSEKSVYWLFKTWRLKHWSYFCSLAVLIMGKSTNKIDFIDLPFPANVKAKLNSHRGSAIGHLLSHMRRLLKRLTEGLEGCSEACNAMLLGSLLRGLHRAGLVGRVQGGPDTTEGVSYEQVLEAVEYIKTAPWYNVENQDKLHPCRLADLIDPVLNEAQQRLQLEAADFGMDE